MQDDDNMEKVMMNHWILWSFQIPSGNLTYLWKMAHEQLIYLFQIVIFHSHVCLPKGIFRQTQMKVSNPCGYPQSSILDWDFPLAI